VRDEIERTRERMSRTIDELDRALVRKKVEVQEKLDVTAPIRQKPWVYVGGVFAAGLALGLITGGGGKKDDDDDDHVKIPRALLEGIGLEQARGGRSRGGSGDVDVEYTGEGSGSGDWEDRARELMSVVARQEEEIRSLRGADLDETWTDGSDYLSPTDARLLDDVDALNDADEEEWDEEWNFDEGDYAEAYGESYTGDFDGDLYMGSEGAAEYSGADHEVELDRYARSGIDFKKPLAMLFAAGVAGALGKLGARVLGGRHEEELLDVEVELEPRGGLAQDVYVDEAGRSARRAARHAGTTPVDRTPRVAGYGPEYGATGEAYPPDVRGTYTAGTTARPYTGEHAGGYTGEYTGEMEVEVELEQRPVRRTLPQPRRSPRVSPLAGAVAAGAAAAVSGMVARLIQNRVERSHEMEVEVELERPRVQPARRSPAPQRPAQPYVPQSASRAPAMGTAATTGTTGELEVEVEMERPAGHATGNWTPTAHPEQHGISGSAFGASGSTGSTGTTGSNRPSDLDVDAETRGATGAAGGGTGSMGATGGQRTGTTGTGNTGTGGSSGPANPPLM
jgi:hypothetical protein